MIVGLTGGIGSGKTTVLKRMEAFPNVAVYIADKEAKQLMNTSVEIRKQLTENFGTASYVDGVLNRKYLAGIVFSNPEKLTQLNAIVHPIVHQHLEQFIKTNQNKDYIVYENAILFENGSDALCDKIITVTAPVALRLQRVMERDQMAQEEVEDRMKNQWKDSKKLLQSHYRLDNVSLEETLLKIEEIHKKLTKTLM